MSDENGTSRGSIFDKDILYGGLRLDQEFPYGDGIANAVQLVLYDAKVLGEVETDIGTATKTGLVVASLENPTDAKLVGTLSGPIAQKFATVDDLKSDPKMPAVVAIFKTPAKNEGFSDATVLQFVMQYRGEVATELPEMQVINEIPF